FIFFFQAEDGIRDFHVTGVQTCALPILGRVGDDDAPLYPPPFGPERPQHVGRVVDHGAVVELGRADDVGDAARVADNSLDDLLPGGVEGLEVHFGQLVRLAAVPAGRLPPVGRVQKHQVGLAWGVGRPAGRRVVPVDRQVRAVVVAADVGRPHAPAHALGYVDGGAGAGEQVDHDVAGLGEEPQQV